MLVVADTARVKLVTAGRLEEVATMIVGTPSDLEGS